MFLGMVAHRDDIVPFNTLIFIHMIGGMVGNINAIFLHDGDSPRVQAVGLYPCTVDFGQIVLKMVQVAMGHLASARISGTKYQYVFHVFLVLLI